MRQRSNLSGKKFGKLTAIEDAGEKHGARFWKCQCDCGNLAIVRASKLIAGHSRSCGCLHKTFLIGQRFGQLTVIAEAGRKYRGQKAWLCRCDCGNDAIETSMQLKSGGAISCGCVRRNDLRGKRFGKLIALNDVGSKRNKRIWLCKCDCGNKITVLSANLLSGNTKSCGCYHIESITGKNNSHWLGGISFEPYCPKFNDDLKKRIRAFFDNRCVLCGKTSESNGKKLDCHHVEYNKQACCDGKPVHFAALCRSCHDMTRKDRDRWEEMLHRVINEVYGGKSYFTKEEYVNLN